VLVFSSVSNRPLARLAWPAWAPSHASLRLSSGSSVVAWSLTRAVRHFLRSTDPAGWKRAIATQTGDRRLPDEPPVLRPRRHLQSPVRLSNPACTRGPFVFDVNFTAGWLSGLSADSNQTRPLLHSRRQHMGVKSCGNYWVDTLA